MDRARPFCSGDDDDTHLHIAKGTSMNVYFSAAGGLAILVALVHSVAGELLILRRLNVDSLPRVAGSGEFAGRALRFSWHLCSIFALGFAAMLLRRSLLSAPGSEVTFFMQATALSIGAAGLLVLFVSRGKHPGWIGLVAVALLTWLGEVS